MSKDKKKYLNETTMYPHQSKLTFETDDVLFYSIIVPNVSFYKDVRNGLVDYT